jgi:hypothetical protein
MWLQFPDWILEAQQSGVISHQEALQLAFLEFRAEHLSLPEAMELELPHHLWLALDRISLSQTHGLRH